MALLRNNLHKKNSRFFPELHNKSHSCLFDEQRLDKRIMIFNHITKTSIESQTYQNYEWIFFISPDLPDKYKNNLKEIKKSKLIIANKYADIGREDIFSKEEFISIRLDDDDAIHPEYLESIKDFNIENQIIAPYYGRFFNLNEDKTIQAHDITNQGQKIKSCGTGCYRKNIYSLGNHNLFRQNFPVHFVKNKNMFFMSIGTHTYTNRRFYPNIKIKNYNIDTLFNQ